ncbi:MAG: hypoxanthine phosphoribosyltransferase [Eubacteriales bacterium]
MGKILEKDIKNVLLTKEQIEKRVAEMGKQISEDYAGKDIIMVGILRGAAIFYADLAREISLPVHMNFMAISSYDLSSISSGAVRINYDLEEDITGKDVIIVEDIIDTGLTLKYLYENLEARGPKSLKTCCCLDKPSRRKVEFKPDYVGFEVPDEFIVGYGLDYAQKYRNLEYLGALKEEIYRC